MSLHLYFSTACFHHAGWDNGGQEEQQRCSEKKKGDVHRWRHIRTRAQHELVQNDPANKMTHRTKSTERKGYQPAIFVKYGF